MCVCVLVSVCGATVAKWDWGVNFFLEFFEHFFASPFYAQDEDFHSRKDEHTVGRQGWTKRLSRAANLAKSPNGV